MHKKYIYSTYKLPEISNPNQGTFWHAKNERGTTGDPTTHNNEQLICDNWCNSKWYTSILSTEQNEQLVQC
jgi:hypothetical protein